MCFSPQLGNSLTTINNKPPRLPVCRPFLPHKAHCGVDTTPAKVSPQVANKDKEMIFRAKKKKNVRGVKGKKKRAFLQQNFHGRPQILALATAKYPLYPSYVFSPPQQTALCLPSIFAPKENRHSKQVLEACSVGLPFSLKLCGFSSLQFHLAVLLFFVLVVFV